MGYSTDYTGRLCCDNCGRSGGVRKRTCPHKVLGNSLRGPRYALPYCPAPALCSDCFRTLGGTKAIHARCVEGAAAMQAKADAVEAGLDAGESFVVAAYGSWHETVPENFSGVIFRGRAGEVSVLVPKAEYDPDKRPRLSDYPTARPWDREGVTA